MARAIKQGQSVYIPFVNGESVFDSQNRPRMYKSVEQFSKSYPRFRLEKPDLIEYVPVVRCRECKHWEDWGACGHTDNGFDSPPMGPDDFCSKGERSTD